MVSTHHLASFCCPALEYLPNSHTSVYHAGGDVAEWFMAAVLKTDVLKGTRGSNPLISALNSHEGVPRNSATATCGQ